MGEIEARCYCKTRRKIKRKLRELLNIRFVGRFWSEGLGQIRWIEGQIDKSVNSKKRIQPTRKIKIRKGLPDQLPADVLKLIQYALLHDFYHTSHHKSKIYVEPEIDDIELKELLKQHHEKTDDLLIQTFQHYDQLAARITRRFPSPRTNRYNWYATTTVDFSKLAEEIVEVAAHPWKLYEYIYQSRELKHLTESLQHGHTSLRTHLLIMTNSIVHDYLNNRLSLCTSQRVRIPLLT